MAPLQAGVIGTKPEATPGKEAAAAGGPEALGHTAAAAAVPSIEPQVAQLPPDTAGAGAVAGWSCCGVLKKHKPSKPSGRTAGCVGAPKPS